MLFTVDERDIREANKDIDAVSEFRVCKDRELKYIFLVYDYETPLKRIPIGARKFDVLTRVGYKTGIKTGKWEKPAMDILNNKNERVVEAIKAFRRLNYNIDRETLRAFDRQLIQFQAKASAKKSTDGDWKIAIAINKGLKDLLTQRKEVMKLLELEEEGFVEDEDENTKKADLSLLDEINEVVIAYDE